MEARRISIFAAGLVALLAASTAQAGLIAYWDFESASGSTVTDVSGNGITGIMSESAALTTGDGGYTGEAIDLTGDAAAQDRMTVSKDQFTPYNPNRNDFSVSFWVKGTVMGGLADHAGTNGYDIATGGKIEDLGQSISLVLGSGGSSGTGWEVPFTTTIGLDADDTWQHVAMVVDRTNAEFWVYVDGVAETTYGFGWLNPDWRPNSIPATVGDIKLDQSDLKLGEKNGGTNFVGYMDDYAIYDVALTPEQVGLLSDGSKNPGNLFDTSLVGDADENGVVNAADYIALKTNMGQGTGAALADGDFDADGDVDFEDLQLLQAHYGETSGSSPVPEPATLGLLAIGAMALIRRRRV